MTSHCPCEVFFLYPYFGSWAGRTPMHLNPDLASKHKWFRCYIYEVLLFFFFLSYWVKQIVLISDGAEGRNGLIRRCEDWQNIRVLSEAHTHTHTIFIISHTEYWTKPVSYGIFHNTCCLTTTTPRDPADTANTRAVGHAHAHKHTHSIIYTYTQTHRFTRRQTHTPTHFADTNTTHVMRPLYCMATHFMNPHTLLSVLYISLWHSPFI